MGEPQWHEMVSVSRDHEGCFVLSGGGRLLFGPTTVMADFSINVPPEVIVNKDAAALKAMLGESFASVADTLAERLLDRIVVLGGVDDE